MRVIGICCSQEVGYYGSISEKQFVKSVSRHLCKSCAKTKIMRLRKKPVSHDGDAGGGESSVGQGVTPLSPSRKHYRRRGGLQALSR